MTCKPDLKINPYFQISMEHYQSWPYATLKRMLINYKGLLTKVLLAFFFPLFSPHSQTTQIKSCLLMVYLNSVYVYHPILTPILIPTISGFRVWGMDPALLNRLYLNIKIPLR